jgi:myosin-5
MRNTENNFPHDLTDLLIMNEPELLYSIKKRFELDIIYTYVSQTLISVNPFKKIENLYSKVVLDRYKDIALHEF